MGDAKIEFSVGGLSFSGEGEQEWLAKQLHDILDAVPTLVNIEQSPGSVESNIADSRADNSNEEFNDPLASHIRAKNGGSNQVNRFLATADWLRRRGTTDLRTTTISKTLRDNQQGKLSNPAGCLNKNVAKGYCEKNANGFFITPDGLKSLGY